jgi:dCMP deaminase
MIIGITGTLGSGKGTIVEFLKEEKGFGHYSVRDFLSEEILRKGLDVNRDSMVSVANDLRAKGGVSYIVEELYKRALKKGGDVVIESLRCPGEIEALKRKGEFVLFAVDADVENRYARIVERESLTDSVSFDKFLNQEVVEMRNSDPNKQNLKRCIEMADYCFKNDWTIADLHGKIEKVIETKGFWGKREKRSVRNSVRPSWDEYFMEICRTVAKRATCDRGKSGCVVVRNKQILVTGYVGSPKSLPHCDEVGHQLEDTIHEDGVKRTHCIRTTHAEQNAICQAAKLGIPIEKATLYCKMEPCPVCAKMIINSGLKRVVCEKRYQSGAQSLLEQAGVKVEVLIDEVERY